MRADWHCRVADAIELVYGRDDAHVAELAHHLASAVPLGDAARAIDSAARAADRALALMADEEAVERYEQALSLSPLGHPDDDRLRRCTPA